MFWNGILRESGEGVKKGSPEEDGGEKDWKKLGLRRMTGQMASFIIYSRTSLVPLVK